MFISSNFITLYKRYTLSLSSWRKLKKNRCSVVDLVSVSIRIVVDFNYDNEVRLLRANKKSVSIVKSLSSTLNLIILSILYLIVFLLISGWVCTFIWNVLLQCKLQEHCSMTTQTRSLNCSSTNWMFQLLECNYCISWYCQHDFILSTSSNFHFPSICLLIFKITVFCPHFTKLNLNV